MRRKAATLVLAVLGLCLLAGPALALAPPPEGDKKTDSEKLDEISRQLKTLADNVNDIKNQLGDMSLSTNRTIADLKSRIDALEQRLGRIESQAGGVRRAMAPPVVGTIRLMNRSAFPATINVNGQPYTVAPGQTRDLAGVAAGAFTYSVEANGFGMIQPPVSRILGADRTFTIYVNP
jgi:outer membrane murein-binding lipoprotein Lpp